MVLGIPSQLRVISWFVSSTDGVDSFIFKSCLLTARHPFRALLLGSTVDSILYRTGVRVISACLCLFSKREVAQHNEDSFVKIICQILMLIHTRTSRRNLVLDIGRQTSPLTQNRLQKPSTTGL